MDSFQLLADPTRRQILDLLATGDKDAGTLSGHFAISQPAVSRHLKALREGGLVSVRTAAQRRVYSVRSEGLEEVDRWLDRYRSFWTNKLDALEDAIKEDK
ncbi:MAG: metalloregulator ArsR/SmtB family transcription factor [Acidimicrobiia bacterium]|nr:metalloregulator ArsR/SmtB family transcription factor [Acidimicrobiia bacterium]